MTSWLHVGNGTPYILQVWHAHAHSRLSNQDECRDLACEVFSVSRWLGPSASACFPALATSVAATWGLHWLGKKRKEKQNPSVQTLMLSSCSVCWQSDKSDKRGRAVSRLRHFEIRKYPCQTFLWAWMKSKQHYCLYQKHLCDFGKDTQNPNGCVQTNKQSLSSVVGCCFFSSSFWIASPNWTHARAPVSKNGLCLSKASSVNKQNKRDDGWLLGPHLISANVQLFKVSCASLICFKAEEK